MNNAVVDKIEQVLNRAKEGHITAVAIAVTEADLSTGSTYTLGEASLAELLGSIELMKHRIIEEC